MRISILGGQVVMVKTTISAEIVKTLSAVKPAALCLRDENKNDIFVATLAKSGTKPALGNLGISVSEDADVIFNYDRPVTEAKVKKEHGPALLKLQQLERQVATAMETLNADLGAIAVEIVGIAD